MHNNFQRHLAKIFLLTTLVITMTQAIFAQENPAPREEEAPQIPSSGKPEYNFKKLPNDTFKPSEKISEDFPVPFPVDI